MFPIILETDNPLHFKDRLLKGVHSPHRTDPGTPIGSYSKLPTKSITKEPAKTNGRRTQSPGSASQYQPSMKSNVPSYTKISVPGKVWEPVKRATSNIVQKIAEERAKKTSKPQIDRVDNHSVEFDYQIVRKSLPHNEAKISSGIGLAPERDYLRAKFRNGEEEHARNTSLHIQNPEKKTTQAVNKVTQESISSKTKAGSSSRDTSLPKYTSLSHGILSNAQERISSLRENRAIVASYIDKQESFSSEKNKPVLNSFSKIPAQDMSTGGSLKSPHFSKPTLNERHSQPASILANNLTPKELPHNPTKKKLNHRDVVSSSPNKMKPEGRDNEPLKVQSTQAPKKSVPVFLSDDEKTQYGDRSPPDYDKLELLGKGGFALVWLGVSKSTGQKVAMKQMLKQGSGDARKNDLYYGKLMFHEGGEARDEFKKYPGIENIAHYIDSKSSKHDEWHISELCGKTLSSQLFEIKGEFVRGERIYGVKFLPLYHQFRTDDHSLKFFIRKMAESFDLLSNYYIVHCDIKPENILISYNTTSSKSPFSLKIIDFGSAYNWGDSGNIRMATPEYLPPEILNTLMCRDGNSNSIEQLAERSCPWSVDVWSLGTILLEIITGVPLWIPLKCKLELGKKTYMKYGLFAVKGRAYDKICQKQKVLVESLDETLSGYAKLWPEFDLLFDLLSKIFRWDPKKRISPADILKHPYLNSS